MLKIISLSKNNVQRSVKDRYLCAFNFAGTAGIRTNFGRDYGAMSKFQEICQESFSNSNLQVISGERKTFELDLERELTEFCTSYGRHDRHDRHETIYESFLDENIHDLKCAYKALLHINQQLSELAKIEGEKSQGLYKKAFSARKSLVVSIGGDDGNIFDICTALKEGSRKNSVITLGMVDPHGDARSLQSRVDEKIKLGMARPKDGDLILKKIGLSKPTMLKGGGSGFGLTRLISPNESSGLSVLSPGQTIYFGLDPARNNSETMENIKQILKADYETFQFESLPKLDDDGYDVEIEKKINEYVKCLERHVNETLKKTKVPLFILNIDCDSFEGLPVSAINKKGLNRKVAYSLLQKVVASDSLSPHLKAIRLAELQYLPSPQDIKDNYENSKPNQTGHAFLQTLSELKRVKYNDNLKSFLSGCKDVISLLQMN